MAADRFRSEEGALTAVVVFGFAVEDGLSPVVGAAPHEVLARQVPRHLVQLLNAGADRGVRFLPYLTNVDGQRRFLLVRELLPVATLAALHQRGEVAFLVDGMVRRGALRLRVHDGATQQLRLDIETPFEPTKPAEALYRLWFEVTEALGWSGRPPACEWPVGEALSWWLIAKDELLTLEAGIPPAPGADVLRAARESALRADVAAAHDTLFETVAQLLKAGRCRERVAEALAEVASRTERPEAMRRAGGLLQAAGEERLAAVALERAVEREGRPEDMEACAGLWFRLGELERARAALQQGLMRSALGPTGRAQLAAVADRLGDGALRDQIVDALAHEPVLPTAVARLVGSFLLERDEAALARAVLDRTAAQHPEDAGLWLELGRACLMVDDREAAGAALERAAQCAGAGERRRDIERLLRLCRVPGLFAAMRRVDALLASGELRSALRQARAAVRQSRHAAEAWLFLGVVRHKLRQERRAESALREALALDDELAEAHNRLGILLVAKGLVEAGHAHLLRAEALAPFDPSPQLHLAQACALLGRSEQAAAHLDAAARLGADRAAVEAIRRGFLAA